MDEEQYYSNFKNADYVLISCFTFAIKNIQKIIHDIKTTNSEAVIICGGPLCNETYLIANPIRSENHTPSPHPAGIH